MCVCVNSETSALPSTRRLGTGRESSGRKPMLFYICYRKEKRLLSPMFRKGAVYCLGCNYRSRVEICAA